MHDLAISHYRNVFSASSWLIKNKTFAVLIENHLDSGCSQWNACTLTDRKFKGRRTASCLNSVISQADILARDSDAVICIFISLKVVTELGNSENKVAVISSLHSGPLKPVERQAFQFKKQELHSSFITESDINRYPILLWWSPLTGETGRWSQCGEDVCFFTINKTYQHNQMTRAFLFYGKDLFLFKEVAYLLALLFSFRD